MVQFDKKIGPAFASSILRFASLFFDSIENINLIVS